MKYKVGDKVRIKSKEWYDKNKNNIGWVDFGKNEYGFAPSMKFYLGQEAVVTAIDKGYYSIDIDHGECYWSEKMFEDSQVKESIFDKLAHSIAEAAKEANILVEQTEGGGIKISPLEVKEKDLAVDTPCMCSDEKEYRWLLGYYDCNGRVFENGMKSDRADDSIPFNYIIPFDKFNPNNIEESLKYNIVK